MFTPPPSPLPPVSLPNPSAAPESLPLSDEKRALAEAYGDADLESPPLPKSPSHFRSDSFEVAQENFLASQAAKQRTGRRLRMAALFFPLVLVGLTLATHMCSYTPKPSPVMPPPVLPKAARHFVPTSRAPEIWRRQATTNTSGVNTATTTGRPGSQPTVIPPSEQPLPNIPLDSNPPTLPLPFLQAFDGVLPSGFVTQTCITYVNEMISSTDFRRCRPFSFLTQTSSQFQNAVTNLTQLNILNWGMCHTNTTYDQCRINMAGYADGIKTSCAADLKANSAVALNTQRSLLAYSVMRDAVCSEDPTTNSYCYVNAAHNVNNADLYYYALPLGIRLPKTTTPTCSACTRNLMTMYATAMRDAISKGTLSQLDGLQSTYEHAADLSAQYCGSSFAARGVVNAGHKATVWTWGSLLMAGLVLAIVS